MPSDTNQVTKCKLLQLANTFTVHTVQHSYDKTLICVLVECIVLSSTSDEVHSKCRHGPKDKLYIWRFNVLLNYYNSNLGTIMHIVSLNLIHLTKEQHFSATYMYQSCTPKVLSHDAKSKALSKLLKKCLLSHAVDHYLLRIGFCKLIVDID